MSIGQLKPAQIVKIISIICNVLTVTIHSTIVVKENIIMSKFMDCHNAKNVTRFSCTIISRI